MAQNRVFGSAIMLVSVIICTHNRAARLETCLRALQPAPDAVNSGEVIVVANACHDDTVARVTALRPGFGIPLRVIEEPQPGLSHARNVGATAAQGRYLVYLDDDAVPAAGWLDAYENYFREYPGIAGGGGPIEPDWGGLLRPSYWRAEFEVNQGRLRFPSTTVVFPDDCLPFGGNMFLRADTFHALGGFDLGLGMNGKRVGLGEETDWFLRLKKTGATLGYVAGAEVSHWVNPRGITRAGLRRRAFEAGVVSVQVFDAPRPGRGWLGWCRHTVSAAVRGRLHMGEQVFLLMELGRLWATLGRDRTAGTP